MSAVVELKNIEKRFGDVNALEGINITINKNEWVSIMGPSGSGKTTLLNILSLMDNPTDGEYLFNGEDVSGFDETKQLLFRREKIGLIFQQFHLIPYLTALENVMLAQYYHSATDEEDARAALAKVGLSHRLTHRPSQLSGGEQQRLCIARALINDPEVLLADEPTGNLDEKNERVIFELFFKLKAEGKTIISITHNRELGALGDRVVLLHHGRQISHHHHSHHKHHHGKTEGDIQ
ncbi:MAG: ABC transporter ATP-binding protein [Campylobacteraceae bacterium]|jgi:putative ABC transport system ATP-binding protein|nr:ABC transporter ATP-binding protein [Campylobacteraceae bacterium]